MIELKQTLFFRTHKKCVEEYCQYCISFGMGWTKPRLQLVHFFWRCSCSMQFVCKSWSRCAFVWKPNLPNAFLWKQAIVGVDTLCMRRCCRCVLHIFLFTIFIRLSFIETFYSIFRFLGFNSYFLVSIGFPRFYGLFQLIIAMLYIIAKIDSAPISKLVSCAAQCATLTRFIHEMQQQIHWVCKHDDGVDAHAILWNWINFTTITPFTFKMSFILSKVWLYVFAAHELLYMYVSIWPVFRQEIEKMTV